MQRLKQSRNRNAATLSIPRIGTHVYPFALCALTLLIFAGGMLLQYRGPAVYLVNLDVLAAGLRVDMLWLIALVFGGCVAIPCWAWLIDRRIQRQAQRQATRLQESEALNYALMQTVPGGLMIAAISDDALLMANGWTQQLLADAASGEMKRLVAECVSYPQHTAKAKNAGPTVFDFRLADRNGTPRQLEVRSLAMIYRGRPAILCVLSNISLADAASSHPPHTDDAPQTSIELAALLAPPKRRVLLVGDHPAGRQAMQRQLESLGQQVDVVTSSGEALERVRQQIYQLILIDTQPPGLDGYALARALQTKRIKAPIVAFSANPLQDELDRCREVGIDSHLTKPVEAATLQALIQSLPAAEFASVTEH